MVQRFFLLGIPVQQTSQVDLTLVIPQSSQKWSKICGKKMLSKFIKQYVVNEAVISIEITMGPLPPKPTSKKSVSQEIDVTPPLLWNQTHTKWWAQVGASVAWSVSHSFGWQLSMHFWYHKAIRWYYMIPSRVSNKPGFWVCWNKLKSAAETC